MRAARVALVVACLVVAALPISAYAVPVPTITAGSATVNVGDTFDILISISSPVEIDSWQFDLAFTPSLLKANSVTEGSFLSESGTKTTLFSPGVIDNATGHITLVTDSFVDLPPGPSGSGVLTDISFTALAPGVSPLTLANVFLNDLDSSSGFMTTDGVVTINGTAVPEPMTVALLAVGFGAVAGHHWRRTRSRRGQRGDKESTDVARAASHFAEQEDTPMKQRVPLTATFVILGTLALTTVLAHAQTTSNGPYYATPSWDQKLQCDTLATCPRFIVLSNWDNAAVLDRESGLVWEQSPDTNGFSRNWHASQVFCNNRATGGRRGWRLPTIQELSSLTDPTKNNPSLPAGHPFSLPAPAPAAWSATISVAAPAFAPNSTSNAWFIEFQHGAADIDVQSDAFQINWCVRSAQGVDAQ